MYRLLYVWIWIIFNSLDSNAAEKIVDNNIIPVWIVVMRLSTSKLMIGSEHSIEQLLCDIIISLESNVESKISSTVYTPGIQFIHQLNTHNYKLVFMCVPLKALSSFAEITWIIQPVLKCKDRVWKEFS